MRHLILTTLLLLTFSAFAQIELETGYYGVELRDRSGNVRKCTLEIENLREEKLLILNINDCPPKIVEVELYYYAEEDFYMSSKIEANTRRGGYKLYEIKALSSTQFKMTSHREYADGGIGKPRSIVATLK